MFIYAILILLPALALSDPLGDLETKLFNALDADKNGQITRSELEIVFLSFDANKDGSVTLAEFSSAVDNVDPLFVGHESVLFNDLDTNSDSSVNKADIDATFAAIDTNSNGSISPAELHTTFLNVLSHVG